MYIVTGASDNHFKSLCQFLRSVPTAMLSQTYVWNLGLTEENQRILATEFPTTYKRTFPYEEYPAYFDIHVNAGEYAWKPVAILKTAKEPAILQNPQPLLWCDAGNRQFGSFDPIEATIVEQGVYTPISWGTVGRWTHPACLAWFKISADSPLMTMFPRNGAIVGFDLQNPGAVHLLEEWAELAQVRDCIAPAGSSRENHRQDQAVLTLLYYKYTGNRYLQNSDFNLAQHQDCD